MKSRGCCLTVAMEKSRPARGAWIEIASARVKSIFQRSRAPRGARGLKCHGALIRGRVLESRPARGAWIEIGLSGVQIAGEKVAPREGRVD